MKDNIMFSKEEVYDMIEHLCDFPFGKICKHHVMCDLLSMMERKGEKLNTKLVKAVVDADDYAIKKLLEERRKKH